jgi:hypothetical protein
VSESQPATENDAPVWCSEHMEPYCPRHGHTAESGVSEDALAVARERIRVRLLELPASEDPSSYMLGFANGLASALALMDETIGEQP